MSISVKWDNPEQTVLRYEFGERWNWQAFEAAVERGFTLMEAVPHTVDVVMDMRKSQRLPDGALLWWKKALAAAPRNQGQTVMVGSSREVLAAMSMFRRINKRYSGSVALARSVLAARGILQRGREQRSPFMQRAI